MSIKKIVDEVWKDEVLRENKITKREIKLILEAFKRYIPEKIVEDGAILTLSNVVTDENITTSRGAGTAIDFGLEIIKVLLGKEESEDIKNQILYNQL